MLSLQALQKESNNLFSILRNSTAKKNNSFLHYSIWNSTGIIYEKKKNKVLPIAHIGYPKAASTFLRYNVFAQHPEIEYMGTKGVYEEINDLLRWKLVTNDGISFDEEKAKEVARKYIDRDTQVTVRIISSQEFICQQG